MPKRPADTTSESRLMGHLLGQKAGMVSIGLSVALSHRQVIILSFYQHLLVILRIDYFVLSAPFHC